MVITSGLIKALIFFGVWFVILCIVGVVEKFLEWWDNSAR